MRKKSILTEEDKDEIIKGMRDATMDRLEELKSQGDIIAQEDANNMANQLFMLYSAFVGAGFTKAQGMELTKFVITMGAGITK